MQATPEPAEDRRDRHAAHQLVHQEHHQRKGRAREWHRDLRRRRSVPANVLV